MGEGWHNNHHYYQASARQGFFWWEIDPTYYVLKIAAAGSASCSDLRTPPARVLAGNRVKHGAFDMGMFKAHWGKANKAVLRSHVGQMVHDGSVPRAGDRLASAGEPRLAERKEALEEFVHSSLESAEELARAARLTQRRLRRRGLTHRRPVRPGTASAAGTPAATPARPR